VKARTRILGVGSPFGEDRLGWLAIDFIRASRWYRSQRAGAVSAESLDRPGPALLAAMDGASHAVLIDAVRGAATPGTLLCVALEQLDWSADAFVSGHAFGLADTLLLGRALALLPPRLTLLAVEASRAESNDETSGEMRAALPAILQRVEACVAEEEGARCAAAATRRRQGERHHE